MNKLLVRNKRSHRAAKIRPEVKRCYQIIDSVNKRAKWDNTNYKIERMVLGDAFVDNILEKVKDVEKKQNNVVSGHEIMAITGINSGPEIGKIVKYIKDNELNREEAIKFVRNYE